MTKQFYQNNTTPAERLETFQNDRRVQKDTFASRASAELGLEQQGRHATKPIFDQSMPKLPDDHWSNQTNAIPPEEPLGYDINEPVVVGETHEIEKSLSAQTEASPALSGVSAAQRDATDDRQRLGVGPSSDPSQGNGPVISRADANPHGCSVSDPHERAVPVLNQPRRALAHALAQ
jgi:hypothetical protein